MTGPRGVPLLAGVFVLLTLIWGTTWSVIRIGLEGIPPFSGVAARFALASLLLLGIARLRGIRLGGSRIERRLWLVNSLFSFSLSYGVVYWAEQWVPSGLSAVLFGTFPLFVAILAHWTLPGERLTRRVAAGVLVGFAGAALIFSEDFALLGGSQVRIGSAVMLMSPLAAAIGSVAVKRWGAGIHPISLTAVPMGLTAVLLGAVALLTERERSFVLDGRSVGALLYLAIMGSAVTFSLYYWLLSQVSATRTSLLGFTIPVVAVGIGVVFLDEPLTPRIVAGAALVVSGVVLAAQRSRRR